MASLNLKRGEYLRCLGCGATHLFAAFAEFTVLNWDEYREFVDVHRVACKVGFRVDPPGQQKFLFEIIARLK